jgi:hypothetical protein
VLIKLLNTGDESLSLACDETSAEQVDTGVKVLLLSFKTS